MKIKNHFYFAIKELINNKKFIILFILNLSIGLLGFGFLDYFKASLTQTLNGRSKAILSADLEISARRALTAEEIQITEEFLKNQWVSKSEVFETFSMLSTSSGSRLVELKGIENNYPLYGEIELSTGRIINKNSPKEIIESSKVWLYPEILLQLNLKIGDIVKIGGHDFTVADTIKKDSAGIGSGFSFALPVYIGLEQLKNTDLYRQESTGSHSLLYELRPELDSKMIAENLFQLFKDPAVRVTSHHNASTQLARGFGLFNDYLGLTSLVALFLTALGMGFLFRLYLFQRLKDIAILKSLGLSHWGCVIHFVIQIFVLSFFSSVVALIVIVISSQMIFPWIETQLRLDLELASIQVTLIRILVISLIGSLLLLWPQLYQIRFLSPKSLFGEVHIFNTKTSLQFLLHYIPFFTSYLFLSIVLAKSYLIGSLFFALLFLSFLLTATIGLLILKGFEKITTRIRQPFYLSLALKLLTRQKASSLSLFVALSLGMGTLHLIPQIQETLRTEIVTPKDVKIPSLFLFDIQPEQVSELQLLLKENNLDLNYLSPLIRARLDSVNGEPFARVNRSTNDSWSREQEDENRFRNRGFNITYREKLSDSEKIVKGEPFDGVYDSAKQKKPYISLEQRFAKRLDLKIGDLLVFDIQGVLIEGEVKNLRQVQWTSFQPNFFIQFQKGLLEEAPQTFIAGLPALSQELKAQVMMLINSHLPTISIIDVSQVVERFSLILNQIAMAMGAMALLSVFVGFIVLFSIINQQTFDRKTIINLLKVFGTSNHHNKSVFFLEFIGISSLALFIGSFLSLILTALLSIVIFDSWPKFSTAQMLLNGVLLFILTLVIVFFSLRDVLKSSPKEWLGAVS